MTAAARRASIRRKMPGPHTLGDDGADQPPGALVEGRVDLAKPPVVHHLAPELHEHDPERALLHRQPQAGFDQRQQAGPRIPGSARLGRGHPPVEIRGDRLERGHQDRPLVGEVVVQDPLADPGLARDLLHREPGVAVAGETPDGGRTISARRMGATARAGGSAGSPFLDWSPDQLSGLAAAASSGRGRGWVTRAPGAAALGGALGFETLELDRRVIGEGHCGGDGRVALRRSGGASRWQIRR